MCPVESVAGPALGLLGRLHFVLLSEFGVLFGVLRFSDGKSRVDTVLGLSLHLPIVESTVAARSCFLLWILLGHNLQKKAKIGVLG